VRFVLDVQAGVERNRSQRVLKHALGIGDLLDRGWPQYGKVGFDEAAIGGLLGVGDRDLCNFLLKAAIEFDS
jgi:hypothetical protein